jgi:hypothetical protein
VVKALLIALIMVVLVWTGNFEVEISIITWMRWFGAWHLWQDQGIVQNHHFHRKSVNPSFKFCHHEAPNSFQLLIESESYFKSYVNCNCRFGKRSSHAGEAVLRDQDAAVPDFVVQRLLENNSY